MLNDLSSYLWIVTTLIVIISAIFLIFYYNFTNSKLLTNVKLLNKESLKLLNLSLAGKIGVGSISGVAISIIIGGKGTIFWIWISSFILSIYTYLETKVGFIYKEKINNNYIGGSFIFLEKKLNKKYLSFFYLILLIITYLFSFILIQSNTIIISFKNILPINSYFILLLLIVIILYSISNGINRIISIVNILVPLMGIIYLIIGIYIMMNNINILSTIIVNIFKESINIKSIMTLPFFIGFQRSIFSNETCTGSTSIVVSLSNSKDYKQEYFFQLIGLYYITLIICTISAIIIMTTDYNFICSSSINGIEIINYAFRYHFGFYGPLISTLIISLFAFSTIITSFYYGNIILNYITKNNNNTITKIIVIIVIVLSLFINPGNIWAFVDISTGLLTLINVYSLIKMRKYLKEE